MPEELADWEVITPALLRPAVKHIRESFQAAAFRCRYETRKRCFAALHSVSPDHTAPSIFKSYFSECCLVLTLEARKCFQEIIAIALAHSEELPDHPVEWTKGHVLLLVDHESPRVKRWIKEVCDEQDVLQTTGDGEKGDEWIFWHTWRAPKWLSMQPNGNIKYDAATAWERMDEVKTEKALIALWKNRWGLSLESTLEDLVGAAHVELAKESNAPALEFSQPPPAPLPPPAVSIGRIEPAIFKPLMLRYRSRIKLAILGVLTRTPQQTTRRFAAVSTLMGRRNCPLPGKMGRRIGSSSVLIRIPAPDTGSRLPSTRCGGTYANVACWTSGTAP